jgi:hypothetical protein
MIAALLPILRFRKLGLAGVAALLLVLHLGHDRAVSHKLSEARLQVATVTAERDALIADSQRRVETGREAHTAAQKAAAPIVKQIAAIRAQAVPSGSCDTPSTVRTADL